MDTGHAGVRTVTSDLPPSTKGPDEHPRRSLKKKACPQRPAAGRAPRAHAAAYVPQGKEHWDRSHDPGEAMVGDLAHSGRVMLAAGVVMVAVFLTFALSGPLPPKEMGIFLGIAVLLDALLVRLMLVRLMLVPILLRPTGRAAWGLPRWLDRLVPDARFGH